MSEPIIALSGLTKTYGDLCAVRDLSLQINRGDIFGFLGANGAGKTTTMRMLCGLVRPTAGSATIANGDVWRDRYAVRSKFGYMAQKFSLYPDLTVLENLRFFAGAYRVPPNELGERIERILGQMDLKEKRDTPAGSLSGGMRQLLALGCALVHEPPVLFLDEPTSGLDPVHRQQMWDLLYDLSHNGITVFVTTHYMDEAERCTEVGFLHEGRLLAKAPPRGLKATFKAKLLELDARPVMDALVRLRETEGVLGVSLRSGSLRVYSPAAEDLLAGWQRQWPFPEISLLDHRWAEPDMEDVFTAYSQGYDAMLNQEAVQ
ncbi:MAG: ABC transporter ATP-binding protein [Chthoniobacterales bacterium]|nr:ABC transporter ATP-binding protein [Chthoniobacterales bacterium]